MIEKILSLEKLSLKEIRTIRNDKFLKVYEDLKKIGFFDRESGEKEKSTYKKVYTILKTKPEFPHQELGEYILEKLYENGKYVQGRIYNFFLEDVSEREKRDIKNFANLITMNIIRNKDKL